MRRRPRATCSMAREQARTPGCGDSLDGCMNHRSLATASQRALLRNHQRESVRGAEAPLLRQDITRRAAHRRELPWTGKKARGSRTFLMTRLPTPRSARDWSELVAILEMLHAVTIVRFRREGGRPSMCAGGRRGLTRIGSRTLRRRRRLSVATHVRQRGVSSPMSPPEYSVRVAPLTPTAVLESGPRSRRAVRESGSRRTRRSAAR
jgi:hypothetical protein